MVRTIADHVSAEVLQADLESLRKEAVELGATDAKIISTGEIIVDERVRAKCINPKCMWYGTNANCPPHSPDLDFVRKTVGRFQFGIFIMTKYPREDFNGKYDDAPANKDRLDSHRIVAKIEAGAFHRGYHMALGFADGPCKSRYCLDRECSVLTGAGCRMGLRARGAMESWGMDAYLMATRAGWEVYPIGVNTRTDDVPYRVTLGLVLIY
ncbi:MAG: DUF2284 domain-containing protein [Thermoleophilia bacterium]|jgi:predicted metal-binding protein